MSSAPHHRREDAEFSNPVSATDSSSTGGPLVAMKVTDLDALSPSSASSPPNFLFYAQKGAQEIQSQMNKENSFPSEDSNKEKTFTEKVSENWELAKEKVQDAWNSTAAQSATKSSERVENMTGKKRSN